MAACSPATSRPMVVVRPVSQPSSSRAIPRAAPVERRQPQQGNGQWLEAQTRMSRCRIALRPCSTAISRGRLVGPPTVSRRASDWTPPRSPKVHSSLDLRPSRSGQGSLTKGACLMRGQFASKPHHHPAAPTLWAGRPRRNFDMFMPAQPAIQSTSIQLLPGFHKSRARRAAAN